MNGKKGWNGGNSIFDSLNYFETNMHSLRFGGSREIYKYWRILSLAIEKTCLFPAAGKQYLSKKLVFVFHSDIPFSPFESKIHAKGRLFDPKYRYVCVRMFERNEFSFSKLFEIKCFLEFVRRWVHPCCSSVHKTYNLGLIEVFDDLSLVDGAQWWLSSCNRWSLPQTTNCENIVATFHGHSQGLITR
jgi:hypothetical protein